MGLACVTGCTENPLNLIEHANTHAHPLPQDRPYRLLHSLSLYHVRIAPYDSGLRYVAIDAFTRTDVLLVFQVTRSSAIKEFLTSQRMYSDRESPGVQTTRLRKSSFPEARSVVLSEQHK